MQLNSAARGKVLNFETWDGVQFRNLKFLAELDIGTILALKIDAPALHQQYAPYLPDGSPETYLDYPYAKFSDFDGKNVYLGIPWIKEVSIVEVTAVDYTIKLRAPTQEQITNLRAMMVQNGIADFTISPL